MRSTVIALLATGLCVGCHPKKPKKPKAAVEYVDSADALLESSPSLAVRNECNETTRVVFADHPESADVTIVELSAGETVVWWLEGKERLWSRDDEHASWIRANVEDGDETVVSECVIAYAASL